MALLATCATTCAWRVHVLILDIIYLLATHALQLATVIRNTSGQQATAANIHDYNNLSPALHAVHLYYRFFTLLILYQHYRFSAAVRMHQL